MHEVGQPMSCGMISRARFRGSHKPTKLTPTFEVQGHSAHKGSAPSSSSTPPSHPWTTADSASGPRHGWKIRRPYPSHRSCLQVPGAPVHDTLPTVPDAAPTRHACLPFARPRHQRLNPQKQGIRGARWVAHHAVTHRSDVVMIA